MQKRGFTLSEALIAMAIIGVVAAIAIPGLKFGITRMKTNAFSNKALHAFSAALYEITNAPSAPQTVNCQMVLDYLNGAPTGAATRVKIPLSVRLGFGYDLNMNLLAENPFETDPNESSSSSGSSSGESGTSSGLGDTSSSGSTSSGLGDTSSSGSTSSGESGTSSDGNKIPSSSGTETSSGGNKIPSSSGTETSSSGSETPSSSGTETSSSGTGTIGSANSGNMTWTCNSNTEALFTFPENLGSCTIEMTTDGRIVGGTCGVGNTNSLKSP